MNTQTLRQYAQILSRFPVITDALNCVLAQQEPPTGCEEDSLRMTVERVDRDMLPNTTLLCSGRGFSLSHPEKAGLLGWQHEVIFAVDAQHQILGQIGAMAPNEEMRDKTQVKFLVHSHRRELCYLVRVNVIGWCKRLSDWTGKDSPLGELVNREVNVTVYREPDEGFEELLKSAWTDDNFRMHFRNGLDGPSRNPDAQHFLMRLLVPVKTFSAQTFFAGFKDRLERRKMLGRGTIGDVSLSYSTWDQGSYDVRFEKDGVMIGFALYNHRSDSVDDSVCPLQISGIDATVSEARALLEEVNRGWRESRLVFTK